MTNKLTKKGLAFATAFAFVASALAGVVPAANASASGPVSLLPAAGTNYDSIRQSGFTFKSQFDVSEFQTADAADTGFWAYRTGSAQALIYKIEAANGENLLTSYFGTADAAAADTSTVDYFEARVNPTGNFTGGTALESAVARYESTGGNTNNIAYIAVYRSADNSGRADGSTTNDTDGVEGNWYGEWDNVVSSGSDVVVARITAPDATTNLTLKVTAFLDENYDRLLTFGEQASAEETTTLFSDENVTTGTAVITSPLATGAQNVLVETTLIPATINPYMVATGSFAEDNRHIATRLYKDGSPFGANYAAQNVSAAASTVSSVDKLITTFSSLAITQGTYTARSFLVGGSSNAFGSWVTGLGSANGVIQGTNADVEDVYATVADTAVVLETSDGYDLKSGTTSLNVTAQIVSDVGVYTGAKDLEAAGVRVRMTVTYGTLSTTSKVTVAGSSSEMSRTAQTSFNVFGTTNSKGQVVFTVNNSVAKDADNIDLTFSVLKINGAYSAATANSGTTGLDITWDNAFIDTFTTDTPAQSGANISVTYEVKDQFGGPISNDYDWSAVEGNEVKPLSVTVVAFDSETQSQVDAKTLKQTVAVSNGKATVSFANFAPLGGHSDVIAYLHRTSGDWNANTLTDTTTANSNASATTKTATVRIYKNDATSGIVSEPAFSTEVSMAKFYSGNLTEDLALFEDASEDGVLSEDAGSGTNIASSEDYAVVTGTVETTGGYGAAAQQVTITGTGLQFRFDGNYLNASINPTSVSTVYVNGYDDVLSQNSATFYTDVDGTYTVYVYAHNVNTAGQTITITSGGKSTTVLLKTFLNRDMFADLDFQKFTWNMPKYPGLGVQVVTAKLTDKWNNPVPYMELEFEANEEMVEDDDYVFVDGQGNDSVYKYTNTSGEATVRVRTFSQGRLAAPGDLDVTLEGGNSGYYDYDLNQDGDYTDAGEWQADVEGFSSSAELRWNGFFGAQATARVGKNAGVVNVSVFNADGRKVTVKVGNKTVTTTASGRVEKIRVKGINSGSRTVTVKIGKKVALTKFVSVK